MPRSKLVSGIRACAIVGIYDASRHALAVPRFHSFLLQQAAGGSWR
jgi:hypothetical protein